MLPEAPLAQRPEAAPLLDAEVLALGPLDAELARHEHLVLGGARLLQVGLQYGFRSSQLAGLSFYFENAINPLPVPEFCRYSLV